MDENSFSTSTFGHICKVKKNSLIIDKIKELMEKLKKGSKSKKLDNNKCKIKDVGPDDASPWLFLLLSHKFYK